MRRPEGRGARPARASHAEPREAPGAPPHLSSAAGAVAVAALVTLAGPARAIPVPEVMVEVGRSFAVDSAVEGQFDEGGFSLALSALWPVEMLRFGATIFADDLGSLTQEQVDDSVSPPVPLGTFHVAHANVAGVHWRMEVEGPKLAGFETFARGDWGVYRFRADQFGNVLSSESKLGWSLGGGVMLPLKGQAFGVTFNFNRTFHELFRDYMSASAAWHWRPARAPRPAVGR